MSGRIRTIKPELLDDAMTAGLSDCAFRLFIASVVLADDYGNLRWEPAWLRAQVFWKVDRPLSEVEVAVRELQDARLVVSYTIADQRYATIRNWEKHQKVSHPGKPRVPGPTETIPTSSGGSPETLLPDLRSQTKTKTPTETPAPRDEPDREPPERRFSTGTSGFEARAAYETAMAKVTGRPFGFPARAVGDLCELLNKHAVTEPSRDAALQWLERALVEWVAVADSKYTAGWSPLKLNDWLNAGRPKANERREPTREPDSQPLTYAELKQRGML